MHACMHRHTPTHRQAKIWTRMHTHARMHTGTRTHAHTQYNSYHIQSHTANIILLQTILTHIRYLKEQTVLTCIRITLFGHLVTRSTNLYKLFYISFWSLLQTQTTIDATVRAGSTHRKNLSWSLTSFCGQTSPSVEQ